MDFIPDSPKVAREVPYFEDVRADDGWQGHRTRKSLDTLKNEVTAAVTRLGGGVTAFVQGSFQSGKGQRRGFRVQFVLSRDDGSVHHAQMDVAALPCRSKGAVAEKASLNMALFMLRNALDGMWFMQQLSPGFVPLLPFMLVPGTDQNLTQLYSQGGQFSHLLPEPGAEFIEGEVLDD